MRSKSLTKIFAVLLCIIALITTLVACNPKGDQDKVDEVAEWKAEFAEIIANSLDVSFKDGFNLDLVGAVDVKSGNTDSSVSLRIQGNVLAPEKVGGDANNDFLIEIVENKLVVFGVYNKGDNLYVTVGANDDKKEFNFKNASIFEALRFFLIKNAAGFENMPNLGDLDLGSIIGGGEMSLKDLIITTLPALLTEEIAPSFTKVGNIYTAEIDIKAVAEIILSLVGGDLGDFDIDSILPETSTLVLKLEEKDMKIKNLDVSVILKGADMDTAVTVEIQSAHTGLFGAVNSEFAVEVPSTLLATAERSVIENRIAGTFNMMGKDKNGKDVVIKTVDWQLVAKVDVFQLLERNFVLSHEDFEDNFFHFQVSHKCTATCAEYCKTLVSAESRPSPERYKDTSIIDLAWSPATMGTANIVADISLFDLVTQKGLDKLISALAGANISELSQMATMLLSGQLVLSLDTDNIMKQIDVKDLNGSSTVVPTADGGLDIIGLITSLFKVVGMNDNGLNISLDGVKDMLGGLLPGALIGNVDAASLIDLLFDGNNVKNIAISGVNGVGSDLIVESSNEFIKNYNTYDKAIRFNANGDYKLAQNLLGVNGYGANGAPFGGLTVMGNPALYTNKIYTAQGGYAMLYAANTDGGYDLVFDGTQSITAYDFKYSYNNGKNLYIKYNYRGFNGLDADAYTPVYGFAGLDLNKVGDQSVTLLTGVMTGESFQTTLEKNLVPLLTFFNIKDFVLPNIESILPLAGGSVECKITFTASSVAELAITDNIKAEGEKYNVDEWVNGEAKVTYKSGDATKTVTVQGASNIKYDEYGYQVPGTYTMTYTSPIAELKFANGESTITKTFTVKEIARKKWITPINTPGYDYIKYNSTGMLVKNMDFGSIEYAYADETTPILSFKLSYAKAAPIISNAYTTIKGGELYLANEGQTEVKVTALGTNYKFSIVLKAIGVSTSGTKVVYNADGTAVLTLKKVPNVSRVIIESMNVGNAILAKSEHNVNFVKDTFEIKLTKEQVQYGSTKFKITVPETNASSVGTETTTATNTIIKYAGEQPTLTVVSVTRAGTDFKVVISGIEQATFDKFNDLIVTGKVNSTGIIKSRTIYKSALTYDVEAKTITFNVNQALLGLNKLDGTITVKADKNDIEFLNVGRDSAPVDIDGILATPVIDSAIRNGGNLDIIISGYSQVEFDKLNELKFEFTYKNAENVNEVVSVTVAKESMIFEDGKIKISIAELTIGTATVGGSLTVTGMVKESSNGLDSAKSKALVIEAPIQEAQ